MSGVPKGLLFGHKKAQRLKKYYSLTGSHFVLMCLFVAKNSLRLSAVAGYIAAQQYEHCH
jgi:hypothetical protein